MTAKYRAEIERLRTERDNWRLTAEKNWKLVAALRDLLRDWLMAHGYDRLDLRDEMAVRTRTALANEEGK